MKNLILGTDWWTDCDDVVAVRLITRFMKEGKVNLLGVGINACMEYSVASLRGFLLADGIKDIPIGIDLAATDFGGNPPYQKRLAQQFCPDVRNEDALDAIAEKAIERAIGARGLRAIMEETMTEIMYEIPSDTAIQSVRVTKGCVLGTEKPLVIRDEAHPRPPLTGGAIT